jgi:hypothetical protein
MINQAFMDNCIKAMKNGVAMGTDGLFILYIGEDRYQVIDPALEHGDDSNDVLHSEADVRGRLEQYYTSHPEEMEMDKDYIEEKAML